MHPGLVRPQTAQIYADIAFLLKKICVNLRDLRAKNNKYPHRRWALNFSKIIKFTYSYGKINSELTLRSGAALLPTIHHDTARRFKHLRLRLSLC